MLGRSVCSSLLRLERCWGKINNENSHCRGFPVSNPISPVCTFSTINPNIKPILLLFSFIFTEKLVVPLTRKSLGSAVRTGR